MHIMGNVAAPIPVSILKSSFGMLQAYFRNLPILALPMLAYKCLEWSKRFPAQAAKKLFLDDLVGSSDAE